MSALVPPFRTTVDGRGAKRREGRAAWRRRQTLLHVGKLWIMVIGLVKA